jgi:hypothetical protein
MPGRRVTLAQIEEACGALLRIHRKVGVRDVTRYLHELHGFKGRTERVGIVLKRLQEEQITLPSPPVHHQADQEVLARLLRRLREAEERATRAEELERRHQDFWAERYAEKLQELERRFEARARDVSTVTTEQYLRVSRRAAELEQRLAQYETVEPFDPSTRPSP